MMGEEIRSTIITDRGVLGDRAYALVDTETGRVVSAKNPRKWPDMFSYYSRYGETPQLGRNVPPVQITLPSGATINSAQSDSSDVLSKALGRNVRIEAQAAQSPTLEEYWPDLKELDHQDTVTDEKMPEGTFFDLAILHILTTSTINQLRQFYPQGRFESRRFRPNIVVNAGSGEPGFVENDWVGKTVRIGDEVRLEITEPCPRCVMTTLPQGDLPNDIGILKTAAQKNNAFVGVYASVVKGGMVHCDDEINLMT